MLLKKINLHNFRQFYGDQEIPISCDADKNVTLIHAENGVGKTTILNAILWCFYKDNTTRFEQPDKIANHEAIKENNYVVKVEVLFEHDGKDYLVSRQINEQVGGDDDFKAFLVSKGNYEPLPNPNAFVDSVVPNEMAKYFFFDGEYAETFSSQGNKAAVRDALENMLGCRTALCAIKDLNHLKSDIEKQVASLTKNDQSSTFQDIIDKLVKENEKDRADVILLEGNLAAAKSARDDITEKLRGTQGASAIQKRRDQYEANLAELKGKKNKKDAELAQWIQEGGMSLVSKQLEDKTDSILEDAKVKGKIPSYIAEKFVQDLIEKGDCICERPFAKGSNEETAIKKLLEDAGTAAATDRLMNARTLMGILSNNRKKALPTLTNIKEEIANLMKDIGSLEAKIEDCHTQLKGSEIKEIAEREEALKSRNTEVDDLSGKIHTINFKCTQRDEAIEENKKKRDKMLQHNERAIGLNKRRMLLDKTIQKIDVELAKYREDSRSSIADAVNNILDKTARRDYYAKIDEKFNLEMYYKESNLSVARSGGENQLLSLAFIASLIEFSANRMESNSEVLKPGTSAPLVLDSPFGQLDTSYRQSTAEFLPKMARQIILLVSKSQGDQEVLKTLESKVGAQYALISENTGARGDKPEDILKIKGQDIPTSKYNCEKTLTRIQKI